MDALIGVLLGFFVLLLLVDIGQSWRIKDVD